jgi:hypothetical protein
MKGLRVAKGEGSVEALFEAAGLAPGAVANTSNEYAV